jgi:hypothetical protein
MAFKVRIGTVEIECDSADDAVSIAERLNGGSATPKEAVGRNGDGLDEDVKRLRTLHGLLRDPQQKFLQAIAEQTFGRTDRVLCQLLNITGDNPGKALGGVLSGITKFAKNVGVTPDQLYSVRSVEGGKEYRPTELLRSTGRAMGWEIH